MTPPIEVLAGCPSLLRSPQPGRVCGAEPAETTRSRRRTSSWRRAAAIQRLAARDQEVRGRLARSGLAGLRNRGSDPRLGLHGPPITFQDPAHLLLYSKQYLRRIQSSAHRSGQRQLFRRGVREAGQRVRYEVLVAKPSNRTDELGRMALGATHQLVAPHRRRRPGSILLANPATKDWHNFAMEWKEHIAWLAPILATVVAFIVV